DLGAQCRLRERNGNGDGEVLPRAAEDGVRLDVDLHVKIARRAAVLARCALALEPDALAVPHARGDAGLDGTGALAPAAAVARRARVVHDQAAALAVTAR